MCPENDLYWRVSKRAVKMMFYTLIILAILYVLFRPMYCDYTDRAKVSELLFISSLMKVEIEKNLLARKTISNIVDSNIKSVIQSNKYLSYYHIDNVGNISLFSEELGTLLVLKPTLINEKVNWSCFGLPHKNVPVFCRN